MTEPRRYRSRPSEIEAIQWTGGHFIPAEIVAFCGDKIGWKVLAGEEVVHLLAGKDGAQGWVPLPTGHWIVRNPGDTSDYWPVDPDYFERKYLSDDEPDVNADLRWLVGYLAEFVPDGTALPARLATLARECIDTYERSEDCDHPAATDDEQVKDLRETVEILSETEASWHQLADDSPDGEPARWSAAVNAIIADSGKWGRWPENGPDGWWNARVAQSAIQNLYRWGFGVVAVTPEARKLIARDAATVAEAEAEAEGLIEPARCESCPAAAEVMLLDGSCWCRECDTAARRLGYDTEDTTDA